MKKPKPQPPLIEGGVDVIGWLSPPGLPIWGYNVACAVLLIAAAWFWYWGLPLDAKLPSADERLARMIAGGSLLICAFLCRVVVAIKRLAAK